MSSNHHSGATWAKVGRRPVVESNSGSPSRVNMISAVSAKGQLHFQVVDGNVNSGVFLEWLKRLVGDIEGKIFLILDGHGIHKTKEVADYVESTNGQLTLFYLPTYSPQLNADEQVWNHVENNDIGRQVINSKKMLFERVEDALTRLAGLPEKIKAMFAHPDVAYGEL